MQTNADNYPVRRGGAKKVWVPLRVFVAETTLLISVSSKFVFKYLLIKRYCFLETFIPRKL